LNGVRKNAYVQANYPSQHPNGMNDIRQLIGRIAEALGPEATPERVEAVTRVILDELEGTPASGGASSSRSERALVTAYGMDSPGIMAAITNVVSGAGANILDVSQKILQGYFTLIMYIDVEPMRISLGELQEQLGREADRLGVRALAQHEDLFNAMHRP
jgi:ACT domain-containing protein